VHGEIDFLLGFARDGGCDHDVVAWIRLLRLGRRGRRNGDPIEGQRQSGTRRGTRYDDPNRWHRPLYLYKERCCQSPSFLELGQIIGRLRDVEKAPQRLASLQKETKVCLRAGNFESRRGEVQERIRGTKALQSPAQVVHALPRAPFCHACTRDRSVRVHYLAKNIAGTKK
jgi:hypothetical protein